MDKGGIDDRWLAWFVDCALDEDTGGRDVTTEALFPEGKMAKAHILAKEDLVLAGLSVAERVFKALDRRAGFHGRVKDGDSLRKGTVIAEVEGDVRALLAAERVSLNLLQRLSGIATITKAFVDRVKDLPVKIVDTRKTTPLLRRLEKYAVRVGGGYSHRFGLYDGILIKENHIRACGGVGEAIRRARERGPFGMKVEVEVECLEELEEALRHRPDIVLLDNMDLETIRKAVEMVRGKALIEVSGGVTIERVREIAQTGVDLISIGSITHSARAVDISMEIIDEGRG